jgi:anhydro-N-acetylmuramic acid kinase
MRGLSLEDGAKTLTDFTASIIGEELIQSLNNLKEKIKEILLCGGGRKNKFLINKIKENLTANINLKMIDDYNIDGDFIESQAFAFLAVRSILKLPISFPSTTGCSISASGGKLIKC